ncbi:MAG TPA: hypothetical protein VM284_05235 [Candidatus Limnocylindria bacterium]|nr:hypothetical protein [Candidatus Limnocylindria bacterium]
MSDAAASPRAEGWSKTLLSIAGLVLIFVGAAMFLLPEYGVENFAWNVSPFVAMTIGGWSIGMGLMALDAARLWARNGLSRVYAAVVAVWLFCVLELAVVVGFAPLLRSDHWLTYPYVLALGLGAVSAVLGAPTLWRRRPLLATQGEGTPRWLRATYAVFAVVTLALAVAALVVDTSVPRVVPEPLSDFSATAFAAFLVALGAAALPMAVTNDIEPQVQFARAGIFPDVLALAAAASFSSTFDFAAHPGNWLYIGAYVAVAVFALGIAWWHRRGNQPVTWRHG